jgi:hypothetical protein
MSLGELFQFPLNIEEAAINPGMDYEGNARISKDTETETAIPQKQGVGKGKHQKRSEGKSSTLKAKDRPSCDFYGRQGHTDTACRIKAKAMAYAKKKLKTEVLSRKSTKLKKLNTLLQQLQLPLNRKKVLMKMTKTNMLL